jgi:hypothetical protein
VMRSLSLSKIFFYVFIAVSLCSGTSWAENVERARSSSCESKNENLIQIQSISSKLSKEAESHCAIKEVATAEKVPAFTFGLISAQSKMAALFEELNKRQDKFMQDSTGCPEGCRKVSDPIVEVSTRPTEYEINEKCPREPVVLEFESKEDQKFGIEFRNGLIKKDFYQNGFISECNDSAMKFAQETLIGNNDLGRYIEKTKCPSVCSYTSTIRLQTKLATNHECQVDLDLKLLCGPPKKERKWTSEAKLLKSFRCEVAK